MVFAMRFAALLVISALSALLSGCTQYTTQAALDGAFISSAGTSFKFIAPSTILTYTQTKISIEARNAQGTIVPYFTDDLNITAIGTGTLDIISQTAFSAGRKDIYIRYNKNLSSGQTELISLRATSLRGSGITGASDGIVAVPASFAFTTPTAATPTTAFSVTVSAKGADGGVNNAYNGTVKLTFDNAVGSVSPATLALTNGTATTSVTFTGTPNAKFHLIATDSNSAQITGTSSDICMGCGLSLVSTNDYFLNPVAVPLSATQLRLSWNKMPDATGYNVYKKVAGNFVQQGTTTGNTFYNDTGLSSGTTYDYRVDAINASAVVLSSATASASPAACVTTVAANITAPVTWNAASSPVCITASISISGAGTLDIQPGAVVLVSPNATITVAAGYLKAIGTATQPIIFTSSHATDPTANRWGDFANGGIIFSAAGVGPVYSLDGLYTYQSGSTLQYVILEYATRGAFSNTAGINVEYSALRHNRAGQTGYALYAAPTAGSNVIRSNHFNNNSASAGSTKSAVYLLQTGGAYAQIVENNIFSANTSYLDGGGLYFEHQAIAAVSAKGNYFYKNTCTDPACSGGAGMYYRGGNMAYTIRYNTFVSNNSAGTSASGGGMLLNLGGYTSANATVQENYFYQNTANVAGGGLFVTAMASPASTLKFNRFANNSAQNGGAIALSGGGKNFQIQQNTFTDNTASTNGGTVYLGGGTNNGNTFTRNYFSNATGGAFSGVVFDSAVGNNNTWTGNYFSITGVTTIFVNNGDSTAYSIAANWWGQTVTGSACDALTPATGICSTTSAGNPTFAAQMGAAPNLCSAVPGDAACVGVP